MYSGPSFQLQSKVGEEVAVYGCVYIKNLGEPAKSGDRGQLGYLVLCRHLFISLCLLKCNLHTLSFIHSQCTTNSMVPGVFTRLCHRRTTDSPMFSSPPNTHTHSNHHCTFCPCICLFWTSRRNRIIQYVIVCLLWPASFT